MKSFEWTQPDSVDGAVAALAHPGAMALAGGVDLLDRLKEHLEAPSRLVSLRKVGELDGVTVDGGGARIGANVTIAEVAAHAALARSHAMLVDAASHAATPQLRAMATLGGNLAQRPRCWYYRAESFVCRKKGGSICFAQEGESEPHAIFGNKLCAATHPSTLATALVALGARVALAGPAKQKREVLLEELFLAPEADLTREIDLKPGELIVGIVVPAVAAGVQTAYHKQVAKQSFDWPIVDVAVALAMDGRRCRSASVILGAVAPGPRRAREAERLLIGATLDDAVIRRAAQASVSGATPLAGNSHKVPILEAVVARTLAAATKGRTT